MKHATAETLAQLTELLDQIWAVPGLVEKRMSGQGRSGSAWRSATQQGRRRWSRQPSHRTSRKRPSIHRPSYTFKCCLA
jgi:hypothetical protein